MMMPMPMPMPRPVALIPGRRSIVRLSLTNVSDFSMLAFLAFLASPRVKSSLCRLYGKTGAVKYEFKWIDPEVGLD